jgi:hypothetical protein
MLALLMLASTPSWPPKTPNDGAHAYSQVVTILKYIRSNLNFKDDSIPTFLNFFAHLISYIKELHVINAILNSIEI